MINKETRKELLLVGVPVQGLSKSSILDMMRKITEDLSSILDDNYKTFIYPINRSEFSFSLLSSKKTSNLSSVIVDFLTTVYSRPDIDSLDGFKILQYEIHSSWVAPFIGIPFLQKIVGKYFAWKFMVKYNRYKKSIEIKTKTKESV